MGDSDARRRRMRWGKSECMRILLVLEKIKVLDVGQKSKTRPVNRATLARGECGTSRGGGGG